MRSEKMARLAVIVYIFSICFIKCIEGQNFPINPCPDLFRYESNGTRYQGAITLHDPSMYGTTIAVKVMMVIDVSLSRDNVGSLEFGQTIEESVQLAKLGRPIKYVLKFPVAKETPRIITIMVNEEIICDAPKFKERSKITLSKTLITELESCENPVSQRNRWSSPVQDDCGIPDIKLKQPIISGQKMNGREWPWLVAIVRKKSLRYICGGTLISRTAVVTAARCMDHDISMAKDNWLIKLGAHDWDIFYEKDMQTMEVRSIKIYDDYDWTTLAGNNIAIIRMKNQVTFNNYVRPACLWSGSNEQCLLHGKVGVVAVWDWIDAKRYTAIDGARFVNAPIVSTEKCRGSHEAFYTITNNSTLCAGQRDGGGPCRGDAGNGLLIKRNNGRYELRGIVSHSLGGGGDDFSCDLTNYVVYTDVAKFAKWIRREMDRNY